jgi:hypothetical protein
VLIYIGLIYELTIKDYWGSLKITSSKYIVKKYINRNHVTDLINRIVQVLRGDLYWVRISTWDAELMKPVKP